jgi:hypothetical protein
MKKNTASPPRDSAGEGTKIDYFSLAFSEFAELFELSLYGPGELTEGHSVTSQRARRFFSERFQIPKLLVPRQVHGKEILVPSKEVSPEEASPEGDGIFLEDPAWRGMLRFADCCPVILFSSEPHPWMLLLHMGFRGAGEQIPSAAWRLLRQKFPALAPERCRAFLGPAIRGCCYSRKMDDPLTLRGMELFPKSLWELRGDLCFFDLPRMGAYLLGREGMKEEHLFLAEECVSCGPSGWYSYRRGDAENRNVLLGGVRG